MKLKGLKKCGIETQNSVVFSEHSFAASNATDHDVGDKNENNCENQQTLVLETQHVNPPEEPEPMANADYDPPKKPKKQKVSLNILTSTPLKEMLEQRANQKEEQETLRKQREEASEAKKGEAKKGVPVGLSQWFSTFHYWKPNFQS
ncbi:hypothetical protein TNCV_3839591 [Trichonephila clavipes]|nr:hypothetical protein TNCV_3839591 [Trichonephila clavipes]